MSEFAAYIQHCDKKDVRKIVRATSLFKLSSKKPFNKAWQFDPKTKEDFDPKREYGYHEGPNMVKYFILLMEDTYDKLKEVKEGLGNKRLKVPKRRSLGSATAPFKAFKIQPSNADCLEDPLKEDKPSAVKKVRMQVQQKQSAELNDKILKNIANEESILKKTEVSESVNTPGSVEPDSIVGKKGNEDLRKKAEVSGSANPEGQTITVSKKDKDSRKRKVSESAKNISGGEDIHGSRKEGKGLKKMKVSERDNNNSEGTDIDTEEDKLLDSYDECQDSVVVKDTGHKKDVKVQHVHGSDLIDQQDPLNDEEDKHGLDLCEDCHTKNLSKLIQVKETFEKKTETLRQKYETVKSQRDFYKEQLDSQLKKWEEINKKLNNLPSEIKKNSVQCWASSLPKFIVQLEKNFKDLEVPDGHFYVGNGTMVRASELQLCADPYTVRGRVDALCDLFWGDDCALYSPSGVRPKFGALIEVKQTPEVHLKAMRIILNAMEWDDDQEGFNTEAKLKEGIRKHTSDKCTEYIKANFPEDFKKITEGDKQKKKKKTVSSKNKQEDLNSTLEEFHNTEVDKGKEEC